jgi:hypothetical protein
LKFSEENVESLRNILNKFIDHLDHFGSEKTKESKSLDKAESTVNKLLYRTRLNVIGIEKLLTSYKKDCAMFHPLSHLLRCMQTDFLTFFYLMTFHIEEKDLVSLSNELDHLDRDYIKSAIEIFQVEIELPLNNSNFKHQNEDEINEFKKSLLDTNKHLFKNNDINSRLKRSKELRETSNDNLFSSKENRGRPGNGMLSEKYKYERILKTNYKKYSDAYLLYKYFSQQYHFSNISNRLLEKDGADNNFFYLIWAISHMFILTDMQIQFLDGKNSEYLDLIRKQHKELEKALK